MSHDHHGHNHGHDHHHHSHDLEPALQNNLYKVIDFDKITCLNEAAPDSGRTIVQKTWAERNSESTLESDADEQLLLHIPFAGSCKLYSILLRGSDSQSSPRTLKLFKNREDLDFSAASDLKPTQSLEAPRSNEVMEIALSRALWNGTTSITVFVEDNHGDGDEDVTSLGYLGFKGDFTRLNREPVNVLYEAAANPSDHKMIQGIGSELGSRLGGGR